MAGKSNTNTKTEKLKSETSVKKLNQSSGEKSKKTSSKTVKSVSSKTEAKKKPVAGIDENGTFRAWDNAKSVSKTTKAKEVKNEFVPGISQE